MIVRTSTAYFAGAGTVVAAVVAGLGGGLLFSNMVNPPSPKTEMTKLEQRMSSKPIPVVNAPSEPVSYLAATQPAASGPITVATPAEKQQSSETVSAAPTQTQPAEASAPQPAAPVTQAATSEQTKAPETKAPETKAPETRAPETKAPETRTTEDALAKARGADVMRDADVRREAKRIEEKRKAERRQQWTERSRNLRRQDRELRDVEQKVREETEPAFAAQPVRMETPRMRLFDSE
jgi:hypothetical protein